MSGCSPLAFDSAVPDQRIVFDELLFVFVAGNVQDIEGAHLAEQQTVSKSRIRPEEDGQKERRRRNFYVYTTASCGVTRLNNLAAQSLTGEARAGSMKIRGPISTTPSKADGSFRDADSRIIPP